MGGGPAVKNFTGANVDPVTYDALVELAAVCAPIPVDAINGFGSYSTNTASGGMDTGGGHCDINAEGLTDAQARTVETNARAIGFVAYLRPRINPYTGKSYGWQRHVHVLRRDCTDLSTQARWQVREYDAGRDGLATPHKDTGSRAYVGMTWARYQEENMLNADDKAWIESRILAHRDWALQNLKATLPPAVWAQTVNRNGGTVSAIQELADAKTQAIAIAQAIQQLDPRVQAAVKTALTEAVVNVNVNFPPKPTP